MITKESIIKSLDKQSFNIFLVKNNDRNHTTKINNLLKKYLIFNKCEFNYDYYHIVIKPIYNYTPYNCYTSDDQFVESGQYLNFNRNFNYYEKIFDAKNINELEVFLDMITNYNIPNYSPRILIKSL